MEMPQGNSLCIYLKQAKISFFFFIYKIREQEGRTGLARGIGTSGGGDVVGKGCRRVSIMQILCTHVCKWKMIPVGTVLGMGG
jgi:hypothetical protein